MMTSSLVCRSISLFVCLLILDGAAIFFFTRGFLLTRTELPLFSNCSDIAQCPSSCFQDHFRSFDSKQDSKKVSDVGNLDEAPILEVGLGDGELEERGASNDDNDKQCWTRPAVKKAIILIIDALRFDFVAPSRNFAGERKPWMNKLPVLQQNVEKKNRATRIFKFIADPPTTTLQRLKGLTTGGLPTFIDIGHSFGAPAIVEDNLILQLVRTGKKVVMMGDDTWMQLFPSQFGEAYPFPSFNVKDLHTVDDGVIRELFPALHRDNWDVLIAHFLGVDHVGHIFGVESPLMPEKLEQYNKVIEDVVELLNNMSEPGGLFEDTLLIVMGDHGQTLNGDHGGGTPEEVETALFALGTHHLSSSILLNTLPSSCDLEDPVSDCISKFSQLDFSATLAVLLGVPIPFGSVGHVNADFFTLVAGSSVSPFESSHHNEEAHLSSLKLMGRYQEVLCINSWQVRRYFEVYARFAITGFPPEYLQQLEDLYKKAQYIADCNKELNYSLVSADSVQAREKVILGAMGDLREQIDAQQEYLLAAASLARSQWTQFGVEWMAVGVSLLISCVAIRAVVLYQLSNDCSTGFEKIFPSKVLLFGILTPVYLTVMAAVLHPMIQKLSSHLMFTYLSEGLGIVLLGVMIAVLVVAYYLSSSQDLPVKKTIHTSNDVKESVKDQKWGCGDHLDVMDGRKLGAALFVALHAFSLFSNSYIVAEGQVIHFLIVSSGLLYLRSTLQAEANVLQAICFLALVWVVPKVHTVSIFKGNVVGESQGVSKGVVGGSFHQMALTCTTIIVPLGILSRLINLMFKKCHVWGPVTLGVTINYLLIGIHWLVMDLASSGILSISETVMYFTRLQLPRLVYTMTLLLTLTPGILGKLCNNGVDENGANYRDQVGMVSSAFLAGASGTVILLMGRKGPLLTLLIFLEVWVVLELQSVTRSHQRMKIRENDNVDQTEMESSFGATVDWSLISAQVFFSTGHSCAFDGLHYSAAFIGFDDFGFYQQGLLLATETFGASHVFPVIGLPLLALGIFGSSSAVQELEKRPIILDITKGYLWFGLLQAFVASITTASVCIQRRHLMVWGIFAPKYVFDAVGFLLVDVAIILSASVYFSLRGRRLHKAPERKGL